MPNPLTYPSLDNPVLVDLGVDYTRQLAGLLRLPPSSYSTPNDLSTVSSLNSLTISGNPGTGMGSTSLLVPPTPLPFAVPPGPRISGGFWPFDQRHTIQAGQIPFPPLPFPFSESDERWASDRRFAAACQIRPSDRQTTIPGEPARSQQRPRPAQASPSLQQLHPADIRPKYIPVIFQTWLREQQYLIRTGKLNLILTRPRTRVKWLRRLSPSLMHIRYPSLLCPGHGQLDPVVLNEFARLVRVECGAASDFLRAYIAAMERMGKGDVLMVKKVRDLVRGLDAVAGLWMGDREWEKCYGKEGMGGGMRRVMGWDGTGGVVPGSRTRGGSGLGVGPGASSGSRVVGWGIGSSGGTGSGARAGPSTEPRISAATTRREETAYQWPRVKSKCPACILSVVGGHIDALIWLRANLIAGHTATIHPPNPEMDRDERKRRGREKGGKEKGLLVLVEAWAGFFGQKDEDRIFRESGELGEVLRGAAVWFGEWRGRG